MNAFLVGGAVRDALLGRAVGDRDWVVVGETPESMLAAGFRAVGRDFPVFLHPETNEEYALARTERKSGPGYRGFVVDADPSVTLEEDLARRDLTINAIAMRESGELVDPFDGRADLAARRLRHVSGAFAEDPVRVLRVARFMARLAPLGFAVAPATFALMRDMAAGGELAHLVPERVWSEIERALGEPRPRAAFETLREANALGAVLPELDALFGVTQDARAHPEIDAGEHALLALDRAVALDETPATRFAALCHDVGKGTTPRALLPRHPGHARRGAALVETLAERLRLPRDTRELAVLVARRHELAHRAPRLSPTTLARLLETLDVLRRPERFERFLLACEADWRGRGGGAARDWPQGRMLRAAARTFASVDAGAIARATAERARLPEAIRAARIEALGRRPCGPSAEAGAPAAARPDQ